MKYLLLNSLLIFVLASCNSTADDPDPLSEEISDRYRIDITVEYSSATRIDSLIEKKYTFDWQIDTKQNSVRKVSEQIDDLIREEMYLIKTCELPIANYHFVVTKTDGEDLVLPNDLKIQLTELPDFLNISECYEGDCSLVSENEALTFNSELSSSSASIDLQLKSKCEEVEFDTYKPIEFSFSFDQSHKPVYTLKQGINVKNVPLKLDLVLEKLKSSMEPYEKVEDLVIDRTDAQVVIDRVHVYNVDDCPQSLGKLHLSLPTILGDYFYDKIYFGPYPGRESSEGIKVVTEGDGVFLFTFECPAPIDVNTEIPFTVISEIEPGRRAEVFFFPVNVKVDVQGGP